MSITLQQKSLTFNDQKAISVANDGGNLTNDAGLVLVAEFLKNIHFDQLLAQYVHIPDDRCFAQHEWLDVIKQWLYQLITGYSRDRDANTLQYDQLFKEALEQEHLSSQFMMSTLLHSLTEENIEELSQVAKKLGDLGMNQQNTQNIVLDLDSTCCSTYGQQEKAEYIYHYGRNGYHPFVAFEGLTGSALDLHHRHGKSYTSTHAEDYLVEMLDRYQQRSSDPTLLMRGDSGFAKPEIYKACERRGAHYVIKLKNNVRLIDRAQHLVQYKNDTDYTKTENQYFKIHYQADAWSRPRVVAIKATRKAEALLFTEFQFVVTDFTDLSPQNIFQLYQKRGNMENFIKEMKTGFFADKTDSPSFLANKARLALSFIAYNIIHLMKQLVFPQEQKTTVMDTIRFQLFHIAGRVTAHARKVQIHLSSSNVYNTLFWEVLTRIQRLNL